MAEELEEIMANTSVERVWKSFEKVREKWEMEAMAAVSQHDRNEQEEWRMEQIREEEEERQEWEKEKER